jgi:hypothetical protein
MRDKRGKREPLISPVTKAKILHSPTAATVDANGFLIIEPRSTSQPKRLDHQRRPYSRDRGSAPEGSSSADNSELPRDTSNIPAQPAVTVGQQPAATPEESPAIILQGLMDKFIFLKENGGKAEAFKALQKQLASNAAALSPYFIPLKDLMNLIMELETFIGKSGEHVGKTPEQVLRGFLQSGMISDTPVNSPYPDISLDNAPKSMPIISPEG